MKKYLISGAMALAFSGMFISCSDEEDFVSIVDAKVKAYDEAFVSNFGTPYAQHDWGFGTAAARMTRYADTNANMWGNIGVPDPVTEAERREAVEWFTTHKEWDSDAVDFDNFFVQQVWKGGDVYTAANGNPVKGSEHMDYLWCSRNPISGNVNWDIDHINNFNHGTADVNNQVWDGTLSDPNDPNAKVFHSDSIQHMVNTSSLYWAYSNSEDSEFHPRYKIKKIGNYYYIGFDYEGTGSESNQQIEADGYYSDWIVRIVGQGEGRTVPTGSPVVHKSTTTVYDVTKTVYSEEGTVTFGRVFCEDIAQSGRGDIDFNDVVFDAFIYETGTYAQEYIQNAEGGWDRNGSSTATSGVNQRTDLYFLAAGGTLQLSVAGKEVHDLFGVGSTTMVNTVGDKSVINGTPYLPLNEYRKVSLANTNYSSLDDIPINVLYSDNQVLNLKDQTLGSAAHKICVPIGTPWAQERVAIGPSLSKRDATDVAFPGFLNYVENPNNTPWSNYNGDYIYPWNVYASDYSDEVAVSTSDLYNYTNQAITTQSRVISETQPKQTAREIETEETVYVNQTIATPGSDETVVYQGQHQLKDGSSAYYLTLNAADFVAAGVQNGSIVRIYGAGIPSEWDLLIYNTGGSGSIGRFYPSDFSDFTNKGYLEITVDDKALGVLTSNTGVLRIEGQSFRVDYVTVEAPSQTPENPSTGGGSEIWTGSADNVQLTTSMLANVNAGNILRFHGTFGGNNWWNCYANLVNWSQLTAGNIPNWSINGQQMQAQDGAKHDTYIDLQLSAELLSQIRNEGTDLQVRFGNFICTKVTLE